MAHLDAQMTARKKMFGMFSAGLVDTETAMRLANEVDKDLDSDMSSDEEEFKLKDTSPSKDDDRFGEKEQKLEATLKKAEEFMKAKKEAKAKD